MIMRDRQPWIGKEEEGRLDPFESPKSTAARSFVDNASFHFDGLVLECRDKLVAMV